jgi:hypothetical protein
MTGREQTAIAGLDVILNRAIGDERGWLGELLPGGSANRDAAEGLGNVYVSVAQGQHTARAGHYHYRQSELFFPVTGTVLWAFRDYREKSPTFGAVAAVVFSEEKNSQGDLPAYIIGRGTMPGIAVPHGVYHVYWSLSDVPARIVCIASTPHDDSDYVRLSPADVPGLETIVSSYGIELR